MIKQKQSVKWAKQSKQHQKRDTFGDLWILGFGFLLDVWDFWILGIWGSKDLDPNTPDPKSPDHQTPDPQILRSPNLPIPTSSNPQVLKCKNPQTSKSPKPQNTKNPKILQIPKSRNPQILKFCTSIYMCVVDLFWWKSVCLSVNISSYLSIYESIPLATYVLVWLSIYHLSS